jgi:hypothetical protein
MLKPDQPEYDAGSAENSARPQPSTACLLEQRLQYLPQTRRVHRVGFRSEIQVLCYFAGRLTLPPSPFPPRN